jgi:hypothetical protein
VTGAEKSGFYTADGLLRGAYIYLLMCQKGKHIFIKVGRSENPERRIRELVTGCAVKPELLCTLRLPSRAVTVKAETAFHHALAKWWTHGEWFCVDVADKSAFNDALRSVVSKYQKPGWPVAWDKIPAQPLLQALAKQASESKRLYRQHGIMRRKDAPINY